MGSIADIKHVVVLVQENRSFDHYFGTLRGVRGFFDPGAIKQADQSSIFAQKKPESSTPVLYPFRLDTGKTRAETVDSNRHWWGPQHTSWNHGKLDRWRIAQPRDTCLGYFTEDDIPYHFALAQTFTICDAYFSSVLGPTMPNRLYLMSGTIDAAGVKGSPVTGNPVGPASPGKPLYRWKSYPEELAAAGIDWAIYDEQDNHAKAPFDLNAAAYFSGWQAALQARPTCLRKGDHQFEHDLAHGKLPVVSWIVPPYDHTEHPEYTPASGAFWIAKKIRALIDSPYWGSTVFVLTYDEDDGFFDHVPPPTSPPGTAGEWVTTASGAAVVGPGFRVPCIVISPWTVGGRVCTTPLDHTSVLRLLEEVTQVPATNISAYRRQTLGSLSAALDLSRAVPAADLPALPVAPPFVPTPLPAPVPPRLQTWPPSLARLAAVGWPKHAYFFKNGKYLRYTTGITGVIQHPDAGYPKPIAAHWPQRTSIDAGFVTPDGKAYLFDAGSYVRYSGVPQDPNASAGQYTPDPGYPKEIWANWKRGWAADLDAAVVWPNGKLYVFKGRCYLRYSLGSTVPDPGYPKLIRGNWPRLGETFPNGIDGAVVWSSTKAFFFHGDTYARYTITKAVEGVDAGYPRPLASFSPELGAL